MKVYFKNSRGKEISLGTAIDDKQAYQLIKNFCDEHQFKIRYMRYWVDPDNEMRIHADCGSWSESFIIEK